MISGRRHALHAVEATRQTLRSGRPLTCVAALLETIVEHIADAIDATGIFDAHAIHGLIRDHMERRINVGYHLWGLLTLFLWMKRWKVEIPSAVEMAPLVPAPLFAIR